MMGKSLRRMILVVTAVMFIPTTIFAAKKLNDVKKVEPLGKVFRIQMPFLENIGQINNEAVQFYAKTLGGSLFVDKDGTLTYNLPLENKGGIILKEIFTDKKISVKALDRTPTRINYFKGKEKEQWKTNCNSDTIFIQGLVRTGFIVNDFKKLIYRMSLRASAKQSY